MQQDTYPVATRRAAPRNPPSGRADVTLGTLVLAAASASFLVAMSGCDSSTAKNAFAGTAADKVTESRLRTAGAMTPIQPFDEGFVVADVQ